MDILAKVLHLDLKPLQQRVCEHFDESPCQNKCYLELPHKEEDSALFNLSFVKDHLVINYIILSFGIQKCLQLIYLLGGKFIKNIFFFHQVLEDSLS